MQEENDENDEDVDAEEETTDTPKTTNPITRIVVIVVVVIIVVIVVGFIVIYFTIPTVSNSSSSSESSSSESSSSSSINPPSRSLCQIPSEYYQLPNTNSIAVYNTLGNFPQQFVGVVSQILDFLSDGGYWIGFFVDFSSPQLHYYTYVKVLSNSLPITNPGDIVTLYGNGNSNNINYDRTNFKVQNQNFCDSWRQTVADTTVLLTCINIVVTYIKPIITGITFTPGTWGTSTVTWTINGTVYNIKPVPSMYDLTIPDPTVNAWTSCLFIPATDVAHPGVTPPIPSNPYFYILQQPIIKTS